MCDVPNRKIVDLAAYKLKKRARKDMGIEVGNEGSDQDPIEGVAEDVRGTETAPGEGRESRRKE